MSETLEAAAKQLPELIPLGDSAVLVVVGDAINAETHARVRAVCATLERARISGLRELVPAYTGVAVHYDPVVFASAHTTPFAHFAEVLQQHLAQLDVDDPAPGKLIEVPVRYGGEFGPDIEEVARNAGMSVDEVVTAHTGAEYSVYMVGFSPGFPYLAGLPERLAMPRRASPRVAVPAGSVGIGGKQTGIYPVQSPGGWRLIGRTSLRLFRPEFDPPTLLQLGDRVRFVAE